MKTNEFSVLENYQDFFFPLNSNNKYKRLPMCYGKNESVSEYYNAIEQSSGKLVRFADEVLVKYFD